MQLLFLGTAASEGFPDAFCGCDRCNAARAAGGRSLRKRSSALIDGELLIDLGPDLMAAAMQHGVDLAGMRYCLQTHEHHDHLDPSHFLSRSRLCGVRGNPRLHYYASQPALDKIATLIADDIGGRALSDPTVTEMLNLTVTAIRPGQSFDAGPYRVLSLAAAHAPELTAMLYLIERGGRRLLYATDTGDLPAAAWEALVAHRAPIHVAVFDHTFGMQGRSNGHMNHEQVEDQIAQMRRLGLLAADAQVYATHLGHHSHPTHEDLAAFTAPRGYAPAYDGLVVTV